MRAQYAIHCLWPRQNLIKDSVIVAGKYGDLVAASYRACGADCGNNGFRTCIAKRCAFHARHAAKQLSYFSCQWRLRANLKALVHLLANRTDNKIRPMTKQNGSKTVGHVDPFIAVNVP